MKDLKDDYSGPFEPEFYLGKLSRSALTSLGLFHHAMSRGINRRKIFSTDKDREDFIERFKTLCATTYLLGATILGEPLALKPFWVV